MKKTCESRSSFKVCTRCKENVMNWEVLKTSKGKYYLCVHCVEYIDDVIRRIKYE